MPEILPDRPLIPRQRISIVASDRQFAAWAWERHLETCRECAHGLEYCPAGLNYLAATRPDTSWVTGYAEGT